MKRATSQYCIIEELTVRRRHLKVVLFSDINKDLRHQDKDLQCKDQNLGSKDKDQDFSY